MELRKNRKAKNTDYDDLGFEEKPPKPHKKSKPKILSEKEHSLDEVSNIKIYKFFIFQFSNFSKENYAKEMKHSLRTQVSLFLTLYNNIIIAGKCPRQI